MKQHKTCDLNTSKGVNKASKLCAKGWKLISFGLGLATFETIKK